MPKNGQRIIALMQELRASSGYEARQALASLGWSVYTFRRNYEELHRLLTYLTEDPRADHLLGLRNRDRLDDALRESVRLIHNFVSGAMSLVWHTTRLRHTIHDDPTRNIYRDPAFDEEVRARVQETFVEDPASQFVQNLRTYAQKFGLPSASITISQANPDSPVVRRIGLPVANLLTWDRWNSRAREFLGSVDQAVDVRRVFEDYERRVREFYVWFEDHFRQLYASELKEFKEKEWELLLLHLGQNLKLRPLILTQTTIRPRREEVFVQVFGSHEFEELERAPDGPNRGRLAIALLKEMGDLPANIELAIETLYAED